MTQHQQNTDNNQVIIYQGEGGVPHFRVQMQGDTVWLSQAQLVDLFQSSKANVSEHIKNIYADGELSKTATVRKFRTVRQEGKREVERSIDHYNLDMVIAIGYRINSKIATRFRQWATARLKEYIVKGFSMDDQRLKDLGGGGYWKELLNRIRDIRASEKVFYRQILDIYATSIDYDPKSDTSLVFFKKVQNKVHFAVHGQTAAEVIYERANSEKEFMGLTTFAGSQPYLADAKIAKNYLNAKELRALGQIVSGYLDFAERQAERQIKMTMKDWAKHLDAILTSTGENLLIGSGSVSHKQAMGKVIQEYKKYRTRSLTNVEKDYLNSINSLNKTADVNSNGKK